MLRIRISLPKRKEVEYKNTDILHDAIVNAWIHAGADAGQIIGHHARAWNFAALGWRREKENAAHTLIISTPDPDLSRFLKILKPSDVIHVRTATSEAVDFSCADMQIEPDPIVPGQTRLGVLMLSPLAISKPETKKWQTSLSDFDPSSAVSIRLSRMANRKIEINVQPDSLYLRANPKHDVLIPVKEMPNGKRAFVIGMRAPLVLSGKEEDVRYAWYAGIGEKTRSGFGCIGFAERGIGR